MLYGIIEDLYNYLLEFNLKNQYILVNISLPEESFDLAFSVLMDFPFAGIEERFDELQITFDSSSYNDNIPEEIISGLKNYGVNAALNNITKVNERNWNEEYEKNTKSIIVNDRIGIAPEWKINELKNPVKIIINPKMSFGTGEHSSTKLISRLMDQTVKKDSFWIDAGTGTGILAILAVKLGAKKCYAFDNNEWSFENAKENIVLNNVQDSIKLEQKDIDEIKLPEADGIAANLFFNLIIKNLDLFYNSLKNKHGDLVLAGILSDDKNDIIGKANSYGFKLINFITEDEWIAIHLKA